MKRSAGHLTGVLFALIIMTASGCQKEKDNPIKYAKGTFPDSVINLLDLNSQYDDYNMALPLQGSSLIVFSSNRKSAGVQFDLEQGNILFNFEQVTGKFNLTAHMISDSFLSKLLQKAITPRNDFGPYRFYSSVDGYEYMVVSSLNEQNNLDLYYVKNRPVYNQNLPDVSDPAPISLFNTASDDAYFCLDGNQDSAYFISTRRGNFDIFVQKRPAEMDMSTWFSQGFTASIPVDSLNSAYDDKCPQIAKKIMVFTSDRPGGFGGFDLYYSVFRKGKWSSPVNLGPRINTQYDEYRPVIGYHPEYTNYFLMFSSNRPMGKGGFDLYFSGYDFPEK
jgi:hypothetical protein